MIEKDLLLDAQRETSERYKWFTLVVILMSELENTEEFTRLILANSDVADTYKDLSERSKWLRDRKNAQLKFEAFLNTLSDDERVALEPVSLTRPNF